MKYTRKEEKLASILYEIVKQDVSGLPWKDIDSYERYPWLDEAATILDKFRKQGGFPE